MNFIFPLNDLAIVYMNCSEFEILGPPIKLHLMYIVYKTLDIAEDILLIIKHNPFYLCTQSYCKRVIHVHTNTGTYTCIFTVSC